jgi:hypothetical protein
MSRKFQRKIEDFVCENCGLDVTGDGYTNHCPRCLWSKHVDVNPGDRESTCRGLMEPVGVEIVRGEYRLTLRCTVCGIENKNKAAHGDDFDAILRLASQ